MSISYIPLFFRIVFFTVIASWGLLHVYQSRETIFQTNQFDLTMIIEYLTDLQLYVRQQLVQFLRSKFFNKDCKVTEVVNRNEIGEYEKECPDHRYISRIIERSPLIIYIEQFLTRNEIDHLIELAEPLLKPSMVYEDNGTYSLNEHRTSSSAHINRHETSIVKCIERRFAQFQGDIELERMEPLQVVKYTPDQEFKPHYDWLPHADLLKNGGQRVTTFFTYLQANCSMGETEFLDIKFNKSLHERFCDILICDEKSLEHGIRFRPLVGNSVFWFNMHELGEVDYLTYHAGRPPGKHGQKIELNTWTREETFFWPFDK